MNADPATFPLLAVSPSGGRAQAPGRGHAARQPFLDALRGVFALMVAFCHVSVWAGLNPWPQLANAAVDGFFLLSGYVLALTYDGRFVAFIVRRFIRLWPLYAVCLTAGYALHGLWPTLPELVWWPNERMQHLDLTDKVVWTLYIEAWATPLLPALVWIARGNRSAGMLMAGAMMAVSFWLVRTLAVQYFALFALGVAASQFALRFPDPPRRMAWFGQQAYSLYLTNWLVLVVFGRFWGLAGAYYAIPAIFIVSWAAWQIVEKPSIRLSRKAAVLVAAKLASS